MMTRLRLSEAMATYEIVHPGDEIAPGWRGRHSSLLQRWFQSLWNESSLPLSPKVSCLLGLSDLLKCDGNLLEDLDKLGQKEVVTKTPSPQMKLRWPSHRPNSFA